MFVLPIQATDAVAKIQSKRDVFWCVRRRPSLVSVCLGRANEPASVCRGGLGALIPTCFVWLVVVVVGLSLCHVGASCRYHCPKCATSFYNTLYHWMCPLIPKDAMLRTYSTIDSYHHQFPVCTSFVCSLLVVAALLVCVSLSLDLS